MAQWQDQSWFDILKEKGYNGADIHYHAMANGISIIIADPIPSYNWNTAEEDEDPKIVFSDHYDLTREMAKQHALTLMPVFHEDPEEKPWHKVPIVNDEHFYCGDEQDGIEAKCEMQCTNCNNGTYTLE